MYEDFREQVTRSQCGYYEANLPCKSNHPPLPTSEAGSRGRFHSLAKKLKRGGSYDEYNKIIREQLEQGIVEMAPKEPEGKVFYISHKAVVKKLVETAKLSIVYDASTKRETFSSNCLNPVPPLQKLLWEILVSSSLHSVLLTSDI